MSFIVNETDFPELVKHYETERFLADVLLNVEDMDEKEIMMKL